MFVEWVTGVTFAQTLSVSAPTCPSPASIVVTDVTPGGAFALVTGMSGGSSTVPGGGCAGTLLDVGSAIPRIVRRADAAGEQVFPPTVVPVGLCGQVAQVLDLATCATSLAVPIFVDSDGDGVSDEYDACPGWDDGLDVDADGVPDGCDVAAVTAGEHHTCALLGDGSVKCWGTNAAGALGLGDTSPRGDGPNEMGANLPLVSLGTGRTATALTAGSNHSCALLDDGSVKCWGVNGSGQLGLGDAAARGDGPNEMGDLLPPVSLGTGRTATAVAAGDYYTCALLDDGSVKCWGYNDYGQLGLGDAVTRGESPGDMGDLLPPVSLGLGRTATAVTAGQRHSCALLDDGSVRCWGYNPYGQLGVGDAVQRGDSPNEMGANLPPVGLGTGRTATAVTAGFDHTCALLDDGSVKCWGYNFQGQLGLGDRMSRGDGPNEMGDLLPPVSLGIGRTATAVAAGDYHTCALLDDDSVKCWGYNLYGQLGLGHVAYQGDDPGEMGDLLAPVSLGATRMATAVAAGGFHTCAPLDDGSVKCWGYNLYGQLGLGDTLQRGDGSNEMGDMLAAVEVN